MADDIPSRSKACPLDVKTHTNPAFHVGHQQKTTYGNRMIDNMSSPPLYFVRSGLLILDFGGLRDEGEGIYIQSKVATNDDGRYLNAYYLAADRGRVFIDITNPRSLAFPVLCPWGIYLLPKWRVAQCCVC